MHILTIARHQQTNVFDLVVEKFFEKEYKHLTMSSTHAQASQKTSNPNVEALLYGMV